jgi:hypothetical protein
MKRYGVDQNLLGQGLPCPEAQIVRATHASPVQFTRRISHRGEREKESK